MTKRVTAFKPRGIHFLAAWRKFRGLRQQQLADIMNTTSATISRVETHKNGYTQGFLEAAAEALRCRPQDIISGPPSTDGDPVKLFESYSLEEQRLAIKIISALSDDDIKHLMSSKKGLFTKIVDHKREKLASGR